jgi:hypothetical protein
MRDESVGRDHTEPVLYATDGACSGFFSKTFPPKPKKGSNLLSGPEGPGPALSGQIRRGAAQASLPITAQPYAAFPSAILGPKLKNPPIGVAMNFDY